MANDNQETVAQGMARALLSTGSNTAYAVAGGASLHLIHAFAEIDGCEYVPVHHEQSAAMAADGFTRASGRSGVAIATSGPGATNMVTGIAGCHFDSVPAIFITGQVSRGRMVGSTGVRQIGFQETPFVEMIAPVCKLALQVRAPEEARYVLERCLWESRNGRHGPVVIDVPDDVQRTIVDWEKLEGFIPPHQQDGTEPDFHELERLMKDKSRPVIVAGSGVTSAGATGEFIELVEKWQTPVALTWGAANLMPASHPLRLGFFGTHGERHVNFAVQNADFVLSVGSRLDTKATGTPASSFARDAVRVMVDIDPYEIEKFAHLGLKIHLGLTLDAKSFLVKAVGMSGPHKSPKWADKCADWKIKLSGFEAQHRSGPGVNPYNFFARLRDFAPDKTTFVLDTGCLLPWFLSGFSADRGQRAFHDFNNTAMGWSLPAMLGIHQSGTAARTAAIVGDGSLMITMNEMRTVAVRMPEAKIVLIDNAGYSMIRQTQDQWFDSKYVASEPDGGLYFPDFEGIARSAGFDVITISDTAFCDSTLQNFWTAKHPTFLRVSVDPSWRVSPQVRFGRPNEDMEPLLPRAVFENLMLTRPLEASRNL